MKHYVLLLEEKRIMKGSYTVLPYIKSMVGNEIPLFTEPMELTLVEVIKELEIESFKSTFPLTIEEAILNDVSLVTAFFFNTESKFSHRFFYELKG